MGSSVRRAPRLAEVAKLAQVSTGLVSRIVNDDPTLRVREETRQRVLDAVKMLNYTPDMSARALRSAHTGMLGFALHHANDPIYVQLVDAAQTRASEQNYSLFLLNTAELKDRGDAFRAIVLGRRVDGLLIQLGVDADESPLREVARAVPSIVFGADRADDLRTIRLDDAAAARMATQHLIDAGHRTIAYLGGGGASSRRRYDGYCAALADAGLPALPPTEAGWMPDTAHDATVRLVRAQPGITGIVAVTTTTALGVHSGIVAAGHTIPDDISLISVHDTWFAGHLNPPLTAVALPLPELGRLAVDLLIKQIDDPSPGEVVVDDPAPQLIVRASTGAPPAPR
ncbi:LacI family DNA-binding transcriptional regulator [Ruania albidiflava]|uniref:LacI family DNA-binding transcriptional regulator n=1 Tax=Ruania albidiflava TaxID=366586 RepID=UPI0009FD9BB3|nr:LacI family DNA-binding transcriptional regulator [Ruania albidiflava]